MSTPTPRPCPNIPLLVAELAALDAQLRDPPRPMSPDLRSRLELGFVHTQHELDTALRGSEPLDQQP